MFWSFEIEIWNLFGIWSFTGEPGLRSFKMESKTAFRELQKLIEGEVLFDDLSRAIYSSAASLYRVKPLGIVKPRHKKDVITVVNYARRPDCHPPSPIFRIPPVVR